MTKTLTGPCAALAAALFACTAVSGLAQDYPTKPIRYIVPFAPAATPKAIVTRLNEEMVRILALPDVRERLITLGADPLKGTESLVLKATNTMIRG